MLKLTQHFFISFSGPVYNGKIHVHVECSTEIIFTGLRFTGMLKGLGNGEKKLFYWPDRPIFSDLADFFFNLPK